MLVFSEPRITYLLVNQFQVNKALLELIKASEMKKISTDWTNLTMETPGIEIPNFHSFRPFFFFEDRSETNID
jgi:hypothetical protein